MQLLLIMALEKGCATRRSQNTYALVVSQTDNTAGGPVNMTTRPGVESNLDDTQDARYGNGKSPTNLPPNGIDDQVTLNPNRQYADSQNRPVSQAMSAFHELAEAYAKIDGGKPYGDYYRQDVVKGDLVEISPPQQGAHNEAVKRENVLRGQRQDLQNTGRAGDDVHLIRDLHN